MRSKLDGLRIAAGEDLLKELGYIAKAADATRHLTPVTVRDGLEVSRQLVHQVPVLSAPVAAATVKPPTSVGSEHAWAGDGSSDGSSCTGLACTHEGLEPPAKGLSIFLAFIGSGTPRGFPHGS